MLDTPRAGGKMRSMVDGPIVAARSAQAALVNDLCSAKAKEARIAMLSAAALKRFGNEERAKRWLEQPHPALDNRPPKDAAADIEFFPKVLGLLHDRLAVAA